MPDGNVTSDGMERDRGARVDDATSALSRSTDEAIARSAVVLRRLEATIAARRLTLEEIDETLDKASRLTDGVTVDLVALETQEATSSSRASRPHRDPVR